MNAHQRRIAKRKQARWEIANALMLARIANALVDFIPAYSALFQEWTPVLERAITCERPSPYRQLPQYNLRRRTR